MNIDITSVCNDSRKAAQGSLFVAVRGFASDGHDYINAVVEKGAAAIIYEDAESGATTIKVKKGSGIVVNDILAIGNKAAKVTKVTSTESIYDVLTITLGVAVKDGNVLYQANAVADGTTTQAALAGVPVLNFLIGSPYSRSFSASSIAVRTLLKEKCLLPSLKL